MCLFSKNLTGKYPHESGFPSFLPLFIVALTALSFLPEDVYSQRKADIGFFAGTSWYQGDLNPYLPAYSPGMAAGLLYRYNFDARTSLRISGIYHNLSGSDIDFPFQLGGFRNPESFNSKFIDFAANWEFNYLPYKTSFRKSKYSPYVTAGLGYNYLISSDIDNPGSQFTIPFGLGFKFNISKRMSAGTECSFRKTFSDNLDGVKNITADDDYLLIGNNDWYTFAGIFITYKIFNFREDCPAYD